MKIKLLTAALLAGLMMAGSALAMDSKAIEEHRQKIEDNYIQTAEEEGELEALEQKVEELEEMIEMMIEDQEA